MYVLCSKQILSTAFLVAILSGCVPGTGDSGDIDPGNPGGSTGETYAFTGTLPVQLARLAGRIPSTSDKTLSQIMNSTDTYWYDKSMIVPAYQDSLAHYPEPGRISVSGVRPATIQPFYIAAEGGYDFVFESRGEFRFPFGHTAGTDNSTESVKFWYPPTKDGEVLPVAWWQRDTLPKYLRFEWIFPIGTVFGEVLFMQGADQQYYPYEIRTKTLQADKWASAVYRPFPTAESFASAVSEKADQLGAGDADTLLNHALSSDSLQQDSLPISVFPDVFPQAVGARDNIPAVSNPTALQQLLLETPFSNVGQAVWKTGVNGDVAHAPSTLADQSIVPKNYQGGLIAVNDASCKRCHQDAARPFGDWYFPLGQYGENWGEQEIFSWHPFDSQYFLGPDGDVDPFLYNYGSARIRQDFTQAGLVAPYDPNVHTQANYKRLPTSFQ